MDTQQKLEAAQRLIAVVTGEPYGDGMIVTDLGIGYASSANGATRVTPEQDQTARAYDAVLRATDEQIEGAL